MPIPIDQSIQNNEEYVNKKMFKESYKNFVYTCKILTDEFLSSAPT